MVQKYSNYLIWFLFKVEADHRTLSSTIWQIKHNNERLDVVSNSTEMRKLCIITHILYINSFHNISDTFSKSHNFLLSSCYTYSAVDFILSVELSFLILITRLSFLFSHIHYHKSWIILSLLICFPHYFLAFCVSCAVVRVQMHVCICVCVCMCLCACMLCMLTCCSRGGGPSQAQTNSSLSLKAMNSSIQASESRLGLQVKKTGRGREKKKYFCSWE